MAVGVSRHGHLMSRKFWNVVEGRRQQWGLVLPRPSASRTSALSTHSGPGHPVPPGPWWSQSLPKALLLPPPPEGKWTGSWRKCWGDPSVLANLFPAVEGFPGLNGRKCWNGMPHPGREVEVSRAGVPRHWTERTEWLWKPAVAGPQPEGL